MLLNALLAVLLASAALVRPGLASAASPAPELPRVLIDVTPVPASGTAVRVGAGGDLQHALEVAQPGDVILLKAGATFTGPFTLPAKGGADWITIRTDAPDSSLPPFGGRIDPSYAGITAKLQSASGAVIAAGPGAHHYRLLGLEIRPTPGSFLYALVDLGSTLGDTPHDIIIDRCFLHGDPRLGSRRGVAMNSASSAVVGSYLADFKEAGADSQAIAAWNGPGPFAILGNFLEAAGENVLFGGADPTTANLVPSDIVIRGNLVEKRLAWKVGESGYDGSSWTVKNLLELKNARRVLVEGNVFENVWLQSQSGFAIVFTVRNQDGSAPWVAVEDVTFRRNVVRHAASGVNLLGKDTLPSGKTRRVALTDNLFDDVGGDRWGGSGFLFQVLNGVDDLVIDHNTAFQTNNVVTADGAPNLRFVFRNNICPHNAYGFAGTGTAPGNDSLSAYFPGATLHRNVLVGGSASSLPPDNFLPPSFDQVGFVDRAAGDYALLPKSPYKGAGTDGLDPGADISSLPAASSPLAADSPGASVPLAGGVGAALVLWASVLCMAYIFVGYPVLMEGWSRLRPRPVHSGPALPRVSVLVIAQDEAPRIAARLEDLLALDYPREQLEILVASDGSGDRTVEIARSFAGRGVRVFDFPFRRGKPAVLNRVVPEVLGEILVLADARQRFSKTALRAIVEPFADPQVGVVTGELILADGPKTSGAGAGVGLYWRYEKRIRRLESRVDSTVGATGALYAVRQRLFEPIPEDTILDDVVIPMGIVRKGYRAVFEDRALVYDRLPATAHEEFRRKARTLAGCFQLFAKNPWLLNPAQNRLFIQTISHKGLRLLMPVLLVAVLLSSLSLLDSPLYRALLLGQGLFYGAALLGHLLRGKRLRVLSIPYVIALLSLATLVAFVRFLRGRQAVTWDRGPLPGHSPTPS
jgi:cellulose synthase/poly-beta-1,6-N-acetylglucosamine synthase-like glycosyltransferase